LLISLYCDVSSITGNKGPVKRNHRQAHSSKRRDWTDSQKLPGHDPHVPGSFFLWHEISFAH